MRMLVKNTEDYPSDKEARYSRMDMKFVYMVRKAIWDGLETVEDLWPRKYRVSV